jgi:uncharacterized protein (UPF0335 family)
MSGNPNHTGEAAMTEASIGHNSPSFAKGQLKSLVERIERLEEEKQTIAADIKEVYAEAKASGFDTKILRKVIAIRKKDRHEREEEQAILDVYMEALGMLADTPLGRAAVDRDVRRAVKRLGEPTELTEEEKAKGGLAALIGKDGSRMTLSTGGDVK